MNHGKMILEACVDSPESAEAAEKGRSRPAGIVRASDYRGSDAG